jgi:hypothetical protein
MNFSHCDHSEKHLTLHDCIATQAYFENGKLGFEFENGFWIAPDHSESHLTKMVRTDFAKVEYTLTDGEDYDVMVYVFTRAFDKRAVGTEWTLQELLQKINAGECHLEFLYQYLDSHARMVECDLHFDKEQCYKKCILKIHAREVCYYWNNLCEDKPW